MSQDLATKYAKPVPRYTSYPTAPHFHAGVDDATYEGWLHALPEASRLSLYLHVPFCDRLCWFCGCHTKQVNRYDPISRYLRALGREIDAVSALTGGKGKVTAIHFGGGSPSMLLPEDIATLNDRLRNGFAVDDDAEFSIEIDPNDMTEERFDAWARAGLSRASIGVQDFDPKVQEAINRLQSFEQTKFVVDGARARGIASVNLDVLYGLPFQTLDTLLSTIDQVLSLRPERIALFGYAHVPWMKKHQNMIDSATLPGIDERFEQAHGAAERIMAAGYQRIGIDHFALPSDSLAIADRDGTMSRNFQGYTFDQHDALIGLGASAIGKLPQGYVQNIVATGEYERHTAGNGVAIGRGVALTDDDRLRSAVIEQLMCNFRLEFAPLRDRFGEAVDAIVAEAMTMAACDADGIVALTEDGMTVTERGQPFVRSIAAGFDAYLLEGKARYSQAV